jgi:predicted tellurium resistance membrane protein TerC
MDWLSDPNVWAGFVTLTVLEIVLGIDNIIFITILVGRLPESQQDSARKLGLLLAMGSRILLLFSLSWVIGLTEPWFAIFGYAVSGRDLVLLVGGLFLLAKATHEIHARLEGEEGGHVSAASVSYAGVLAQIAALDVVFSLDSVITAVGMVDQIAVMVAAVVAAVLVMMVFAASIGSFVERHPTIKMLALSFLLMIGVMLMVEGLHGHIPKGYVYFAMAFSVFVELLNLRVRGGRREKPEPVKLRQPYAEAEDGAP